MSDTEQPPRGSADTSPADTGQTPAAADTDLAARVDLAERIIRALQESRTAMYSSDFESSWPKDHIPLLEEYLRQYGVDLR